MSCNCGSGNKMPEHTDESKQEPTEYQSRLSFCSECEELRHFRSDSPVSTKAGIMDRCGVCGCFVKAKALIPFEHCPLEKW